MISIKNYPNNRDEFVGAETLMKFLHGRTSGVFSLEDSAAVTAKQNQMAVNVSDGYGWISDAQNNGCVWWVDSKRESGQTAEVAIDPADAVLARIDRVVVEWVTTLYSELPSLKVLKGAKSSNPKPPALTNNTTTRQISLAQVRVNAGALKLTPADITDERLNPAVCGLVTYSEKFDTSVMQAQFETLLKSIQDELAAITSGTGFDPAPVRVHNVKISPSLFQTFSPSGSEENGLHNDLGYEYKAEVPVSGVLESMTPYATFSLPSLDKAGVGIANQISCYNGGIVLYADGKPEAEITALTIECRKAVV